MVNRENPHMGPFSSPGPVTIELNEAQDVAQKCKLSDAGALHQALQMWADVYYWTNESQNFEPIKIAKISELNQEKTNETEICNFLNIPTLFFKYI